MARHEIRGRGVGRGPIFGTMSESKRRIVFRPVSADIDFVTVEEAELARWREHSVFQRSLEQRAGAEPWVFYEGPPTANGKP